VRVTNGGDDEQQELLRDMAKEHQANQAGSSYRWAVAARADGSLELQLQVLPVACSILMARQEFVDDGAAVMVLKRWEITVTTFNGAHGLNGPVPRLFTEQPEELRSGLKADPDSFLLHLNQAMKR
jgi:hypothetical protein